MSDEATETRPSARAGARRRKTTRHGSVKRRVLAQAKRLARAFGQSPQWVRGFRLPPRLRPPGAGSLKARFASWGRSVRSHAYLVLLVAAALVFLRALDFRPPTQVRDAKTAVAQLVGDVPEQGFARTLSNPQAVQLRATLRLYPDNSLMVSKSEPELDALGRVLSQPVVTTIFGMNATLEQTVRLQGGDLEVHIQLNATPRLLETIKAGSGEAIELETELVVKSHEFGWWQRRPVRRVHVDSRAFLSQVEQRGHRIVFAVNEHLFSLDLELHRPKGA